MRWTADADAPGSVPTVFYGLPELHYPQRLNAARVLFEDAGAKGWRDRGIYVSGGAEVSCRRVEEETARYAQALHHAGVRPGDRVLLRLHDSLDLVVAMLAVFRLGGVAVPTYVQYRAEDIAYRIRDAEVTVAVVGRDLLDEVGTAVDGADDPRVLVVGSDPFGRFESLDHLASGAGPAPDYADTSRDDIALLLYTSGSTGQPKGTCHSHADLLAVCDTYARYSVKLSADDVIAGPPAFPFALGIGFFVLFPLRFGCTAVLDAAKAPAHWLSLARRHGATVFVAVATYYNMLLPLLGEGGHDLRTVTRYLCGGEPLMPEVARAWEHHTGRHLSQFLGTTELLHCFLGYRHEEDEVRSDAIGRAVPGYEVVVRDKATFAPLPPGEHGLLTVRGATGTKYWRRPDKQREAVVDGWNVVPDIVSADADGYIRFVARDDEMIKSAGIRISPTQAEDALLRSDAVTECACVAAPDPNGIRTSVVKAYVVLAAGVAPSEATVAALQQFVKDTAAPYLYPRVVEFVESLPRTPSGKLRRLALRDGSWLPGEPS